MFCFIGIIQVGLNETPKENMTPPCIQVVRLQEIHLGARHLRFCGAVCGKSAVGVGVPHHPCSELSGIGQKHRLEAKVA